MVFIEKRVALENIKARFGFYHVSAKPWFFAETKE